MPAPVDGGRLWQPEFVERSEKLQRRRPRRCFSGRKEAPGWPEFFQIQDQISEWRVYWVLTKVRSVMTEAADFTCPRCTSRYKFVRVRADPDLPGRLIHCRVCKEPFAPTDGEYVLKYFLVDKTKKHNGIDLRMNHPGTRVSKPRLVPRSLAV